MRAKSTSCVTATVSDALSKPLAATISADVTAADVAIPGPGSKSLTGEDLAGNQTTVACPYLVRYAFLGFQQPIPPGSVKGGSTIPVKFRLSGNQGLNIFKSGSPASASYTCSGTAPTDAIEQTVTASTSGLSYDATTDQYTYVWKTDKAWAGSCRALVAKLADNTTKTANFQFTK